MSYQIALERIQKAAAKNPTELNLSWLRLTEIPKEIQLLKNLQVLNLSFNKISRIENLQGLPLQELYLNSNQISKIENLQGLPLQHLDLSSNQISKIENLKGLPLEVLYLNENQISKIENLQGLPLQNLNLWGNQITKIENLEGVPLQNLDFANNKISKIENLQGLPLQNLNFTNNQINKIENLQGLPLQVLYLSKNQISRIENLQGLPLQSLYLYKNQIIKIENLQGLPLQLLDLSFNQIIKIEDILLQTLKKLEITLNTWKPIDKNMIYIQVNPIQDCPQEILEQGRAAIEKYFEDKNKYGDEKLFEVKIEIIGEGGSGKTTTWRTLQGEEFEVPCKTEPSTVGMVIKENMTFPRAYQNEKEVKGHLWDFGGQEEQYQTHQFFLNPQSIFLLLHDDRAQKTNFRYWLNIIKVLGYDSHRKIHSPVLVILNKKENKGNSNFDRLFWHKHFKELNIAVIEVDFKDKVAGNIEGLKKQVTEIVGNMPHLNEDFPANWINIRKAIEAEKQKGQYFIAWDNYSTICTENGVAEHEDQQNLALLFHNLGILIFYKDSGVLEEIVILDANWAADAVYVVLKDKAIKDNKGLFTRKQAEAIWNEIKTADGKPKYKAAIHKKMLGLMLKDNFELAYPTKNKDEYMIPYLFEPKTPDYTLDMTHPLSLRLDFNFLPNGFLSRFIVRKHDAIKVENGLSLVWKNGVYIENNGCIAKIEEFTNMDETQSNEKLAATIDINIVGNINNRKFLLHTIREEFKEIAKDHFNHLQYEELIPCNCVVCSKSDKPVPHERSTLEGYLENNLTTIICKKSFKPVTILPLLEGVSYDPKKDKGGSTPKVTALFDAVSQLLERNKTRTAIDLLLASTTDDAKSKSVLLAGQLTALEEKHCSGGLTAEAYDAKKVALHESILNIIQFFEEDDVNHI
jgi:internalin A